MAARDPAMSNGLNGAHASNGLSNGVPYVNGNKPLAQRLKMERRMSTPMAPPFMVSAPGKVIVFGEHSVVHGKVRRPTSYGTNSLLTCCR